MSRSLVKTLGHIIVLWAGVLVGYYVLLPYLGLDIGYNSHPFLVADYYAAWSLATFLAFERIFLAHLPQARRLRLDSVLSAFFVVAASIFLWAFSFLSAPHIPSLEPATDLLLATPWYFLPKSIEIFLQQLLIAAFVFELDRQRYALQTIIITYALAFGAAHTLLIFTGSFPPTVLIMTLGAILSAAVFPYLLLRVRHGFLYSYVIHWAFYALMALALRFVA